MTVAIMQPYLFPYLGYWQLIKAVDIFVILDNVEFSKGGWLNRNNILVSGKRQMFTVPIKKAKNNLLIKELKLADNVDVKVKKILKSIVQAYSKAPLFKEGYPVVEESFLYDASYVDDYIEHSINMICKFIGIDTKILRASDIKIDKKLKGKNRVIALCNELSAQTYINAIGGFSLYKCEDFKKNGIDLHFIKTKDIQYKQFDNEFVANLSIIDLLMFNDLDQMAKLLTNYSLV